MPGGPTPGVGAYPVQNVFSDTIEQSAQVRALAEAAGVSYAELQRAITAAGFDQVRAAYAMRGAVVHGEVLERHRAALAAASGRSRGGRGEQGGATQQGQ